MMYSFCLEQEVLVGSAFGPFILKVETGSCSCLCELAWQLVLAAWYLARHELSNSGASALGASKLLRGFPGAAYNLRWSLRFRDYLNWIISLFLIYGTYLVLFIGHKPAAVLRNLTVAVWVKTYSLYLAALQRLSASKPQTTGLNFDPNVGVYRWFGTKVTRSQRVELKMEACNCIWFESAVERCIVNQGPAAAVAWCFLEVFSILRRSLQLYHQVPRTLMWCQVPWWQWFDGLTDRCNPFCRHESLRPVRC